MNSPGLWQERALEEMGLAPLWVRREAAVAATTPTVQSGELWEALQNEVRQCRACGLCESRTQTVFGVGARNPDWLFVGEAPGAEEDARGEPFVGQAGKLLDNMLASIGLARGQTVYIANVLKCRPPGNRNPSSEEVAQCRNYLMRQIELLEPRMIVALGRFAAQTLTDSDSSVGKLRGRVHRLEHGARNYPLIVTFHPSYLLRTPEDKRLAWQDLCLARLTYAAL